MVRRELELELDGMDRIPIEEKSLQGDLESKLVLGRPDSMKHVQVSPCGYSIKRRLEIGP